MKGCALIGFFLVLSAAGCASVEYTGAVTRGDAPWYVIIISSPDADIEETQVNVYKLLRRADSSEGKKEGLSGDRRWGEGHGSVAHRSGGKIVTSFMITPEPSDPNSCGFQLTATYLEERTQFAFVATSAKQDSCEKVELQNPYFSARIQDQNQKWMTLDFQFRRGGG